MAASGGFGKKRRFGISVLLCCPASDYLRWLERVLVEFGGFLIVFFCLIAVKSLNTAIECIVDHLAPGWEEFARDAKDLGSLATMCLLLANGVFVAAVLTRHLVIS